MSVSAKSADPSFSMDAVLQKIATGPELSKALSRKQARTAMELILAGKVDPVQAGVFLIALRMKRETDEENLGILDAIRGCSKIATAGVDEVVDIADPYDGFMRSLPASPFLPVVLATLGVATVSHGLESVGPKFGVSHRQVLRAAGVAVDLSLEEASARVSDASIGWAYVDQQEFCPNLHALGRLRKLIVKRPAITTAETMVGPVRGSKQTHLFTGYVHKGYPRVYAMLARAAGFGSALIVRGVEGGVIPSLRQSGQCFYYHQLGDEQSMEIKPADCGIEQSARMASVPEAVVSEKEGANLGAKPDTKAMARTAAEAGLEALGGKPGPTRDALIYGAALCLWHLRRHDSMISAADAVRKVLGSKKVLTRFRA